MKKQRKASVRDLAIASQQLHARATAAESRVAELTGELERAREAVRVLGEAFDGVQRLVAYDNFAGCQGLNLVDAKRYLDAMTSGNYMHHSRAAVGCIGRVLAWINKSAAAMNTIRQAVRANPLASAAVRGEQQPSGTEKGGES